jgi:hypothetical protein
MKIAMRTLPPSGILKMDETSCKLVGHHFITVKRGPEGTSCLFEGDLKACITAIATINAAGEKFPLWAIAKGKTDRCEANLRHSCSKTLEQGVLLTHQQSGWTAQQVAAQYVHWIQFGSSVNAIQTQST